MTDALSDVYKEGYYRTMYELQKGFSVGFDVAKIDDNYVHKVLSKPWAPDGYNFSERIWQSKTTLINTVHRIVGQNVLTGADPQKAINAIAGKMKTSKYNAGRLVMTEEAYFSSLATGDCYKNLDVEKYEILATLDDRTSDICRSMDGRVFEMKDYQAGTTAPPFHVYCRSTTVPAFDNDYGIKGSRAARDGDGKTYYVPGDMRYSEWKAKFVDGVKYKSGENEQHFRPVEFSKEFKTERGTMELTMRRCTSTVNTISVSDNCDLSRKELHNIDTRVTKAFKKLNIKDVENRPEVYVITHEEMQKNVIASYNPVKNIVAIDKAFSGSIDDIIELQKGCACPDNELSTLVHELLHWQDAMEYRKHHGEIIRENYKQYIAHLNKNRKKAIDKLGINEYNVSKISSYAESSYKNKDFDEVYTEHQVRKVLE